MIEQGRGNIFYSWLFKPIQLTINSFSGQA